MRSPWCSPTKKANRHKRFLGKALAIAISTIFLSQDILYGASLSATLPKPMAYNIPAGLGRIEAYHRGTSGKTIFFVQDAHDSIQAQMNIARIIRQAVTKYGVKTVFEEGYEGPVPTDEVYRSLTDPKIREAVSYYLLDHLRIGGAEYAHMNRFNSVVSRQSLDVSEKSSQRMTDDRRLDFQLIGADSIKGHFENVRWFRRSVKEKAPALQDIDLLIAEFQRLADEQFPKRAKTYLKLKQSFDAEQIDLLHYLQRARPLAPKESAYPSIDLLLKADQVNRPAMREQIKNITVQVLFEELQQMDGVITAVLFQEASMAGENQIYLSLQHLSRVKRLLDFKMTPAELHAVKQGMLEFDTKTMAQRLVQETKRSAVFSKTWEASVRDAIQFYESALKRETAAEIQLEKFLTQSNEKTAMLVYGGFHRQGIESLLARKGVSYYVVSPTIHAADAQHRKLYQKLMENGYELHPTKDVTPVAERLGNASVARQASVGIERSVASDALPHAARLISELELVRVGGSAAFQQLEQFQNQLSAVTRQVLGRSHARRDPPEYVSAMIDRRLSSAADQSHISNRSEVRQPDDKKKKKRKSRNLDFESDQELGDAEVQIIAGLTEHGIFDRKPNESGAKALTIPPSTKETILQKNPRLASTADWDQKLGAIRAALGVPDQEMLDFFQFFPMVITYTPAVLKRKWTLLKSIVPVSNQELRWAGLRTIVPMNVDGLEMIFEEARNQKKVIESPNHLRRLYEKLDHKVKRAHRVTAASYLSAEKETRRGYLSDADPRRVEKSSPSALLPLVKQVVNEIQKRSEVRNQLGVSVDEWQKTQALAQLFESIIHRALEDKHYQKSSVRFKDLKDLDFSLRNSLPPQPSGDDEHDFEILARTRLAIHQARDAVFKIYAVRVPGLEAANSDFEAMTARIQSSRVMKQLSREGLPKPDLAVTLENIIPRLMDIHYATGNAKLFLLGNLVALGTAAIPVLKEQIYRDENHLGHVFFEAQAVAVVAIAAIGGEEARLLRKQLHRLKQWLLRIKNNESNDRLINALIWATQRLDTQRPSVLNLRAPIRFLRSEMRVGVPKIEDQLIHVSIHSTENKGAEVELKALLDSLAHHGELHEGKISVTDLRRHRVMPEVSEQLTVFEGQKKIKLMMEGAYLDDCCRLATTAILKAARAKADTEFEIHFPVNLMAYPHDYLGESSAAEKIESLRMQLEHGSDKLPFAIYVDGDRVPNKYSDFLMQPKITSQPRVKFYLWSSSQTMLAARSEVRADYPKDKSVTSQLNIAGTRLTARLYTDIANGNFPATLFLDVFDEKKTFAQLTLESPILSQNQPLDDLLSGVTQLLESSVELERQVKGIADKKMDANQLLQEVVDGLQERFGETSLRRYADQGILYHQTWLGAVWKMVFNTEPAGQMRLRTWFSRAQPTYPIARGLGVDKRDPMITLDFDLERIIHSGIKFVWNNGAWSIAPVPLSTLTDAAKQRVSEELLRYAAERPDLNFDANLLKRALGEATVSFVSPREFEQFFEKVRRVLDALPQDFGQQNILGYEFKTADEVMTHLGEPTDAVLQAVTDRYRELGWMMGSESVDDEAKPKPIHSRVYWIDPTNLSFRFSSLLENIKRGFEGVAGVYDQRDLEQAVALVEEYVTGGPSKAKAATSGLASFETWRTLTEDTLVLDHRLTHRSEARLPSQAIGSELVSRQPARGEVRMSMPIRKVDWTDVEWVTRLTLEEKQQLRFGHEGQPGFLINGLRLKQQAAAGTEGFLQSLPLFLKEDPLAVKWHAEDQSEQHQPTQNDFYDHIRQEFQKDPWAEPLIMALQQLWALGGTKREQTARLVAYLKFIAMSADDTLWPSNASSATEIAAAMNWFIKKYSDFGLRYEKQEQTFFDQPLLKTAESAIALGGLKDFEKVYEEKWNTFLQRTEPDPPEIERMVADYDDLVARPYEQRMERARRVFLGNSLVLRFGGEKTALRINFGPVLGQGRVYKDRVFRGGEKGVHFHVRTIVSADQKQVLMLAHQKNSDDLWVYLPKQDIYKRYALSGRRNLLPSDLARFPEILEFQDRVVRDFYDQEKNRTAFFQTALAKKGYAWQPENRSRILFAAQQFSLTLPRIKASQKNWFYLRVGAPKKPGWQPDAVVPWLRLEDKQHLLQEAGPEYFMFVPLTQKVALYGRRGLIRVYDGSAKLNFHAIAELEAAFNNPPPLISRSEVRSVENEIRDSALMLARAEYVKTGASRSRDFQFPIADEHGDIVKQVEYMKESGVAGPLPIVVLNLDSHHDYYSGSGDSAAWARKLGSQGLTYTLTLLPVLENGNLGGFGDKAWISPRALNRPEDYRTIQEAARLEFPELKDAKITTYTWKGMELHENNYKLQDYPGQIWISIDYDFFSVNAGMNHPGHHISVEQLRDQLKKFAEYLEVNDIRADEILGYRSHSPALSYLNRSREEKWIAVMDQQIHELRRQFFYPVGKIQRKKLGLDNRWPKEARSEVRGFFKKELTAVARAALEREILGITILVRDQDEDMPDDPDRVEVQGPKNQVWRAVRRIRSDYGDYTVSTLSEEEDTLRVVLENSIGYSRRRYPKSKHISVFAKGEKRSEVRSQDLPLSHAVTEVEEIKEMLRDIRTYSRGEGVVVRIAAHKDQASQYLSLLKLKQHQDRLLGLLGLRISEEISKRQEPREMYFFSELFSGIKAESDEGRTLLALGEYFNLWDAFPGGTDRITVLRTYPQPILARFNWLLLDPFVLVRPDAGHLTPSYIRMMTFQSLKRSEVRMISSYKLKEAFGEERVGPTFSGGRNEDFLYDNGRQVAVRMPWAKFVYRALDEDGNEIPDRVYKITHYASDNEMLFEEASKLFKLQQEPAIPDVPKLVRAGMMKSGGMWIEQQGLSNARSLDQEVFGRLPRLFETLIRAGEIIQGIHARGIVHADLKPAQFLINSAQELQLIDFGNAREIGSASARDNYTTGYVPLREDGTPMTTGLAADTDIYSFIMMIAELLGHQMQLDQAAEMEPLLRRMHDKYLKLVLESWNFDQVQELWLPVIDKVEIQALARQKWPQSMGIILKNLSEDLEVIRKAVSHSELRSSVEKDKLAAKEKDPLDEKWLMRRISETVLSEEPGHGLSVSIRNQYFNPQKPDLVLPAQELAKDIAHAIRENQYSLEWLQEQSEKRFAEANRDFSDSQPFYLFSKPTALIIHHHIIEPLLRSEVRSGIADHLLQQPEDRLTPKDISLILTHLGRDDGRAPYDNRQAAKPEVERILRSGLFLPEQTFEYVFPGHPSYLDTKLERVALHQNPGITKEEMYKIPDLNGRIFILTGGGFDVKPVRSSLRNYDPSAYPDCGYCLYQAYGNLARSIKDRQDISYEVHVPLNALYSHDVEFLGGDDGWQMDSRLALWPDLLAGFKEVFPEWLDKAGLNYQTIAMNGEASEILSKASDAPHLINYLWNTSEAMLAHFQKRLKARSEVRFEAAQREKDYRITTKKIENMTSPAGVFLEAAELADVFEREVLHQMDELMALLSRHKNFDIYIEGTMDQIQNKHFRKLLEQYRSRIHFGALESRASLQQKKMLIRASFFESPDTATETEEKTKKLKKDYGLTQELALLEYTHSGALKGFLDLTELLKAEEIRELPARYVVKTASGYLRMAESYLASLWNDLQKNYVFQWSA